MRWNISCVVDRYGTPRVSWLLSGVLVGQLACESKHDHRRETDPERASRTLLAPPDGCMGSYRVPVSTTGCDDVWGTGIPPGLVREGTIVGASDGGVTGCAFGAIPPGQLAVFLFNVRPVAADTDVWCELGSCRAGPLRLTRSTADLDATVHAEWRSQQVEYRKIDPPQVLPDGSMYIEEAIRAECPAGAYPGPALIME